MIHIQSTNTAFNELERLPDDISFRIIRQVSLLANYPKMGVFLESSFPNLKGLRQLIFKRKWRVIYDFDEYEKTIYVVGVQSCRRELPAMRDLYRRKREID